MNHILLFLLELGLEFRDLNTPAVVIQGSDALPICTAS